MSQFRTDLLEKDFPKALTQSEKHKEIERNRQEALELMFPRSGADDRRSLESRVKADQNRAMELEQVLVDNKLDVLSETFPKEAA